MNNLNRLGDIAIVVLSNVDKKSKEHEKDVKLCNFVDVYNNWAINKNTSNNFMIATANDNQVAQFMLKKGQVAITKDSETRDDIGVSTYIADDLKDTLLGYHCALVTPDFTKLNGKFLNAYLHSPRAIKHFSNQASGSGQRYALTASSILNLPIPDIDLKHQEKIGNFFSVIDRIIENNKKIISELESMAKTIYDYWFLQYDFPNENGKPYKSSGGKMVWSEELKREIPEGWEVNTLEEYLEIVRGVMYEKEDISNQNKTGYIPLLKSNNIQDGKVNYDDIIYVKKDNISDNQYLEKGSIIITMSSGSTEHVGKMALMYSSQEYTIGAFCAKISIMPKYKYYLSMNLMSNYFKKKLHAVINGTSIKNINNKHIIDNFICYPADSVLEKYEQMMTSIFNEIGVLSNENQELSSLRDFLLPMLMNGQVTFKE